MTRFWRSLLCALAVLLCVVGIASAAAVYTFGTLPGSPSAGDLAWITDGAGTETVGSAAAGGGASMHLVAYDASQTRWEFVMAGAPTSPPTADADTYLEGVQVSYDATISGLSAANVQAAIDELAATGAGAAHVIEDEGTPLTQRPALSFAGSGVSCADDAGNNATECTMLAPIRTIVAALPGSPTIVEQTYIVTDAAALDDCDTGSGSLVALCAWDGSDWQAIGGGGADGVGVSGIAATGGTATGPTVTITGAGTVSAARSSNTITITGTGDGVGVSGIAGGSGGTTTGATVTLAEGSGITTVRSSDTVTISAPVAADHIDAITEIAASIKSGEDGTLITGTEGAVGECAEWDANGDLVTAGTGAECVTSVSGDVTIAGSMTAASFIGADSDGFNYAELYDNPSGDIEAPTGDNVRLFTKDDQTLWMKRSGDGASEALQIGASDLDWMVSTLASSQGGTEAVATDSTGPFGWYNAAPETSASGLIDYAPLLFCTDGADVGDACTVSGSGAVTDCGAGASSGCEEWGGFEINKAGKFEIEMNVAATFASTLGRYSTCSGGTVAGARCTLDTDCVGGGTCSAETGAVGTTACVTMALWDYSTEAPVAGFDVVQRPVYAPVGQKTTGTAALQSRAQLPVSSGRWVVTVASPPFQFYPVPMKCHTTQTSLTAHTILTGVSSIAIRELP